MNIRIFLWVLMANLAPFNHLPIKQRARSLPIAQREAVEKELDKLEKTRID